MSIIAVNRRLFIWISWVRNLTVVIATAPIAIVICAVPKYELMRQRRLSVSNWSALSIHEFPTMANGRRMLQQIVMHLAICYIVCPFQMVVQRVVIRREAYCAFFFILCHLDALACPQVTPAFSLYIVCRTNVFIAALTSSLNSSLSPTCWRSSLASGSLITFCNTFFFPWPKKADVWSLPVITWRGMMIFATSSESMAEQLIYSFLCLISRFPWSWRETYAACTDVASTDFGFKHLEADTMLLSAYAKLMADNNKEVLILDSEDNKHPLPLLQHHNIIPTQ